MRQITCAVALCVLVMHLCYGDQAPLSIPITAVPLTSSGFTYEQPTNDSFLVIDAIVGTPGQHFNLTLDYRWETSFLFDSKPSWQACYYPQPRHYYNSSASSSYVDPKTWYGGYGLGYPYAEGCGEDWWGSAAIAYDTWQLGNSATATVPFNYGRNVSSLLSSGWASDGIFGLGKWPAYKSSNNTLRRLLMPYKNNVVSVYLQRLATPVSSPTQVGYLTIGARDAIHCSQWTLLDLDADETYYWSVEIDYVILGATVVAQSKTAIFSSHSEFIYTPYFDYIAQLLHAEYDWDSDTYRVSCDAVKNMPDFVFSLSGTEFNLPASDYARKTVGDEGTQCTLFFLDTAQSDEEWIFGTTFNRQHCLAFDYDQNKVAIGKTMVSKAISSSKSHL